MYLIIFISIWEYSISYLKVNLSKIVKFKCGTIFQTEFQNDRIILFLYHDESAFQVEKTLVSFHSTKLKITT